MNNIQAVFFDFDDTLQDREKAYEYYCGLFMDKYMPQTGRDERKSKIGDMLKNAKGGYLRREEMFPLLIKMWKWEDHPPIEELVYHFNHTFGNFVVLFEETKPTLSYLKEKGYKLGIITNGNSTVQNAKLDSAGIRKYFDVIIVSGDFGIDKPSREIFDEAARRINVKNENIVYIGDHPENDIKGALGADMKVIWMNFGYFKDKCTEEVPQIKSVGDIMKIL